MMRKLIWVVVCLVCNSLSYGQSKTNTESEKIKKTILSFLNWHKIDQHADSTNKINEGRKYSPIIVFKQIDTMTKVNIDMAGVEDYLIHLKSSKVMSDIFINELRQYHQKIANEVDQWEPYPTKEGTFAIPGLDCDVIFGCEPEEILDHIREGKFTGIYQVDDKALVKFDITTIHQYVFTLTRHNGHWLIDSFGFDKTHLKNLGKGQHP